MSGCWVGGGNVLTASSHYILLSLFLVGLMAVVFGFAAAAAVGAFLILVAGVPAEAQGSHATMFPFHCCYCYCVAVLLAEGKRAC